VVQKLIYTHRTKIIRPNLHINI